MSLPEWRVAALEEIAEPGAVEFSVGEGEWPLRGVVVRWEGRVFAYVNVCAHAGHPLNLLPDGFFNPERTLLQCSSHGAVYEPDSGVCVGGPCMGAKLVQLESRVEENAIYVRAPASMF